MATVQKKTENKSLGLPSREAKKRQREEDKDDHTGDTSQEVDSTTDEDASPQVRAPSQGLTNKKRPRPASSSPGDKRVKVQQLTLQEAWQGAAAMTQKGKELRQSERETVVAADTDDGGVHEMDESFGDGSKLEELGEGGDGGEAKCFPTKVESVSIGGYGEIDAGDPDSAGENESGSSLVPGSRESSEPGSQESSEVESCSWDEKAHESEILSRVGNKSEGAAVESRESDFQLELKILPGTCAKMFHRAIRGTGKGDCPDCIADVIRAVVKMETLIFEAHEEENKRMSSASEGPSDLFACPNPCGTLSDEYLEDDVLNNDKLPENEVLISPTLRRRRAAMEGSSRRVRFATFDASNLSTPALHKEESEVPSLKLLGHLINVKRKAEVLFHKLSSTEPTENCQEEEYKSRVVHNARAKDTNEFLGELVNVLNAIGQKPSGLFPDVPRSNLGAGSEETSAARLYASTFSILKRNAEAQVSHSKMTKPRDLRNTFILRRITELCCSLIRFELKKLLNCCSCGEMIDEAPSDMMHSSCVHISKPERHHYEEYQKLATVDRENDWNMRHSLDSSVDVVDWLQKSCCLGDCEFEFCCGICVADEEGSQEFNTEDPAAMFHHALRNSQNLWGFQYHQGGATELDAAGSPDKGAALSATSKSFGETTTSEEDVGERGRNGCGHNQPTGNEMRELLALLSNAVVNDIEFLTQVQRFAAAHLFLARVVALPCVIAAVEGRRWARIETLATVLIREGLPEESCLTALSRMHVFCRHILVPEERKAAEKVSSLVKKQIEEVCKAEAKAAAISSRGRRKRFWKVKVLFPPQLAYPNVKRIPHRAEAEDEHTTCETLRQVCKA